jgi:hypothetical protein
LLNIVFPLSVFTGNKKVPKGLTILMYIYMCVCVCVCVCVFVCARARAMLKM